MRETCCAAHARGIFFAFVVPQRMWLCCCVAVLTEGTDTLLPVISQLVYLVLPCANDVTHAQTELTCAASGLCLVNNNKNSWCAFALQTTHVSSKHTRPVHAHHRCWWWWWWFACASIPVVSNSGRWFRQCLVICRCFDKGGGGHWGPAARAPHHGLGSERRLMPHGSLMS